MPLPSDRTELIVFAHQLLIAELRDLGDGWQDTVVGQEAVDYVREYARQVESCTAHEGSDDPACLLTQWIDRWLESGQSG